VLRDNFGMKFIDDTYLVLSTLTPGNSSETFLLLYKGFKKVFQKSS